MSDDKELQAEQPPCNQSELIEPLEDGPPMFTNDASVQWWYEKSLTRYAESRGLQHVTAWRIKEPNGRTTCLLTRNQDVLIDDPNIEQFGCKIDILALAAKVL